MRVKIKVDSRRVKGSGFRIQVLLLATHRRGCQLLTPESWLLEFWGRGNAVAKPVASTKFATKLATKVFS